MKFSLNQMFDYPVDIVEKYLFLDEEIGTFLVKEMPSLIELEKLEITKIGNSVKRRIRYLPKPLINKVGPKKIPPSAMEWIEHSSYDMTTHKLVYDNMPTHPKIGKMFSNSGEIVLIKHGDKTERIISGELKIKVPIFGIIAEKIIYKTAQTVLEEEAVALRKYIELKEKP